MILFDETVQNTVVLHLRGTDPQHGVTVARTDSLPFTLSRAAASSSSVPTLRVGYRGNLDEDNSRAASDEAGDDVIEEEEETEPGRGDHGVARLESVNMKV